MDQYVGQIFMFGGNYAPVNYAFCEGQLLAVSQFNALYAALGTAYGGDGQTTFGLPNLNGRIPIGTGTGAGLPTYNRGAFGGAFRTTLLPTQIPSHSHAGEIYVSADLGESHSPVENGTVAATPPAGLDSASLYQDAGSQILNPVPQDPAQTTLSTTGGSQQFTHYQPLVVINYIIAINGLFPSRN